MTFGLKVETNFNFCDTSERELINLDSTCDFENKQQKEMTIQNMKNSTSLFETFFVFNQIKHLVSTVAFECKMTKTIATTYQNFFGQNSLDNLEELDLNISREMCESIVKEKSCIGNKMTCIDGVCKSNLKLEKNFLYLQHKTFEVINCRNQERL